jgi:hypothetical protein
MRARTRTIRRRPAGSSLPFLAVALLSAGCATVQASTTRAKDLHAWFDANPLPESCDAVWPKALRLVAAKGFPLSAGDAKLVGDVPPGAVAQFISAGNQTYRTKDGGLTSSTDWNKESGTRLRIVGAPSGESGCKVRFDVIAGGVTTPDEMEMGPDWGLSLDLLREVDPAAAARVETGLPPAR